MSHHAIVELMEVFEVLKMHDWTLSRTFSLLLTTYDVLSGGISGSGKNIHHVDSFDDPKVFSLELLCWCPIILVKFNPVMVMVQG